jgi:hypothetical protein
MREKEINEGNSHSEGEDKKEWLGVEGQGSSRREDARQCHNAALLT